MKRRLPKPKKIEELKRLLRERKTERADEQKILDSIRNPQKVVVMKIEPSPNPVESKSLPTLADIKENQTNPLQAGPRPESLEGYSLPDIILLAQDGYLNEEELAWFNKKSGRWNRRLYIPPERERRWMS